ncbi:phosphate acyltransferase PlsX [Pseudomonas saliphila]|uniref:phosphate acyltransferase PlsX n=1 Tax=Pseudomonas saliphila TaxID=2586906 RepID=UPI00123AFDC3|nr:phosphate acyltransferase PlsX [Pseudomonas saliphila]
MTKRQLTLAIDVMGGDFGPRCIIPAISRCLQQHPELNVVLVGSADPVQHLCRDHVLPPERVRYVFTSDVILPTDSPSSILRAKPDASMRVAIEQVRDGAAHGCLSGGNTGALMVLAKSVLGTLEGIQRPAIMAALPVAGHACYVLDLGANVDCSAKQLFEFAVMGSEAVSELTGIARPRVGLLNIGEEINKGNQQVREVSEMLRACEELNYIGHVEGGGLFRGQADVVVCDGFVGNIMLKSCEGLADYMRGETRRALTSSRTLRLMGPLLRRVLRPVFDRHDPGRYNGATLLGLSGVVVKSHGSANQAAFEAAIGQAILASQAGLSQRIAKRLDSCRRPGV